MERKQVLSRFDKKEKLKDEHGLQSYFIKRIEKHINSRGRIMIGWDEILEGGFLVPNAVVMSWRGTAGGMEAANQNHEVVMTPGSHCYFDQYQSKNAGRANCYRWIPDIKESVYI